MILAICVIIISISVYMSKILCKPHIYKYSENGYCIKIRSVYLDLRTYNLNGIKLWKSKNSKLFKSRCITTNIKQLEDILNDL